MQRGQKLVYNAREAHFLPYVASLDPLWDSCLSAIQGKLRRDLGQVISQYLPFMKNLAYLELGIDVLEFLIYDGRGSDLGDRRNLSGTCEDVRRGRREGPNDLLAVFDMLSHIAILEALHLRLAWRDFLVNKYEATGVGVDGVLTLGVKTEMRMLYLDMVKQRVERLRRAKKFDDEAE
jgi:hypothetical protein